MSILEEAIGWLTPPQCISCGREGSALCLGCSTSELVSYGEHCWICNVVSPGGRACPKCRRGTSPRFVWITTNYHGAAKGLVKIYKFGHQRAAASQIANLMAVTLADFNSEQNLKKLDYQIVPVPTATSRIRRRSFDHCALLAKTLSRKLDLKRGCVLGRTGQSRQLGAPRSQRLKQPEASYFVRWPDKVKGRNILLIDDVVTTGATIRAVTKILRQAGARRVDALIFAKRL